MGQPQGVSDPSDRDGAGGGAAWLPRRVSAEQSLLAGREPTRQKGKEGFQDGKQQVGGGKTGLGVSGMGGWLRVGKEGNEAKIGQGAPWEDLAFQAKGLRLCSLGEG